MDSGDAGSQDRKSRREVANCNERRRMQSINTGFESLRLLLPGVIGEKVSKVCPSFFPFERVVIM